MAVKKKPKTKRKTARRKTPASHIGVPVGNVVKKTADIGKPRHTPHGFLPDGKLPGVTGNDWWKRRAKYGRDILFAEPQLLWEAACEYFKWAKENPWVKAEAKNTKWGIEMVEVPVSRPLTMHALCLYLGCSLDYVKLFKLSTLPAMKDEEKRRAFLTVLEAIEITIYTQKFEGASVGAFNANIIARDLGLADTQNVNINDTSRKETSQLFPLPPPDDFEDAQIVEE